MAPPRRQRVQGSRGGHGARGDTRPPTGHDARGATRAQGSTRARGGMEGRRSGYDMRRSQAGGRRGQASFREEAEAELSTSPGSDASPLSPGEGTSRAGRRSRSKPKFPPFSRDETWALVVAYVERAECISGHRPSRSGQAAKDRLWKEITVAVNAVGRMLRRNLKNVKKRMRDLRRRLKEKLTLWAQQGMLQGKGVDPDHLQVLSQTERALLPIISLNTIFGEKAHGDTDDCHSAAPAAPASHQRTSQKITHTLIQRCSLLHNIRRRRRSGSPHCSQEWRKIWIIFCPWRPQLLEWEKNLHLMLGQHWMRLDRHPVHLDPAPFSRLGKGWCSTWRDYGSKGGFLMHPVI
ncbi:unnamed protein product [Staurois parvus]|uniref:Myb/SANT-like DNA-binding domain-containing protein n=1 Tax=Staurois parvus TaxID=386267 RepID=A0ABN9BZ41_9NEOB|nr:unnamed protein product [Staurois parvus]